MESQDDKSWNCKRTQIFRHQSQNLLYSHIGIGGNCRSFMQVGSLVNALNSTKHCGLSLNKQRIHSSEVMPKKSFYILFSFNIMLIFLYYLGKLGSFFCMHYRALVLLPIAHDTNQ